MMPNVAGPKSTRNQIFGYSVVLAAVAAAPVFTGLGGSIYAFGALLLNVGFLALAFKVWQSRAGEKDEVQPESLYEISYAGHSNMQEYRDKPTKFSEPTEAEVKARTKRNIALALGLLFFVILVPSQSNLIPMLRRICRGSSDQISAAWMSMSGNQVSPITQLKIRAITR